MIPDKVKEFLKEADPISLLQEVYIKAVGVQTGSSVFGGFKEGSDIDFILPPKFSKQNINHDQLCYESKSYNTEEFQGFYVKTVKGEVLNLLFMWTTPFFEKQVFATKHLLLLKEKGVDFSNKDFRVKTYQDYKAIWEEANGGEK